MTTILFSDTWWVWVWNNFSMSILGFPVLIAFILKLIAIYIPTVKGDKIIDLISEYWPKGK